MKEGFQIVFMMIVKYYDGSGTYHKDCPKNWVDIKMTP